MEKITIIGNVSNIISKEYEIKGEKQTLIRINIAVNKTVKKEKITNWYSCSYWSKTKPYFFDILEKGKKVIVTGTPKPNYYEKDGKIIPTLEINIDPYQLEIL